MINGIFCRMAVILLFPILMTAIPEKVHGQSTSSAVADPGNYEEQVAALQRENRKLEAHARAHQDQLDAFWAEWSAADKAEAEAWFFRSDHNPTRLRRDIGWYEAEHPADKAHWEELGRTGIPPDFQVSHLAFLRQEQHLLRLRRIRAGNMLLAVKEYGGEPTREFVQNVIEDYSAAFWTAVSSAYNELVNCFQDVLTEAVKYATVISAYGKLDAVQDPAMGLWEKGRRCVVGIPLKMIINALEAALKQHFIRDMEDAGVIHREVIDYWWDHLIMAREKQPMLTESIEKMMQLDFWAGELFEDLVRDKAARDAAAAVKAEYRKEWRKGILGKGRLNRRDTKAFRVKFKAQQKDRVRVKARGEAWAQYYKAANFAVKYLERGAMIFEGRHVFKAMAATEIQKYRFIRECLRKCGKPVTGKAILAVFQIKSASAYQAWIRENCRPKVPDDERQELLDAIGEILLALDGLMDRAELLAGEGLIKCASAREHLDSAETALVQAESGIVSLRSAVEDRRAIRAAVPSLLAVAQGAADEASRIGVVLGNLYGEAASHAEDACSAVRQMNAEKGLEGKRRYLERVEASATAAGWKQRDLADLMVQLDFSVARAEDAAGDVVAMAGELAESLNPPGNLEGLVASAGGYLAAGRGLIGEGRDLVAEITDILSMAEDLAAEGRERLIPLSADPVNRQLLDAMGEQVDRIRDAGTSLWGCFELVAGMISGMEARHIDAVRSQQEVSAAANAAAGDAVTSTAWISEAEVAAGKARAALDVAEVTYGMARTAVQLAEECQSLGRVLYCAAALDDQGALDGGFEEIDTTDDDRPASGSGGFAEVGQADGTAEPERGDFVALGSDEAREVLSDAQQSWTASQLQGRGFSPQKLARMFQPKPVPGYEEDLARAMNALASTVTLITTGRLPEGAAGGGGGMDEGGFGGGGGGLSGGGGAPEGGSDSGPGWEACVRKFCPMCYDGDDIDLINVSTDDQCNSCKLQKRALIEDCYSGGESRNAADADIDDFKVYYVYECEKTEWNEAREEYETTKSWHAVGPDRPRPRGMDSCWSVWGPNVLVPCEFEAERREEAYWNER